MQNSMNAIDELGHRIQARHEWKVTSVSKVSVPWLVLTSSQPYPERIETQSFSLQILPSYFWKGMAFYFVSVHSLGRRLCIVIFRRLMVLWFLGYSWNKKILRKTRWVHLIFPCGGDFPVRCLCIIRYSAMLQSRFQ
jgi:hypothetical protein